MQDRDQRPDRRRRDRRARVKVGVDDVPHEEEAGEAVREGERDDPAARAERERPPLDPLEVDLVAGEEEQHAEAEVREETRRGVDLGEACDLRADQDPEQQLDDDDREDEPRRDERRDDRRDGRRGDDDEERLGVDADHEMRI